MEWGLGPRSEHPAMERNGERDQGIPSPNTEGGSSTLGEISTERAIQGLSCPDEEPHFQRSSTPAPQVQLESLLLGTSYGKVTDPK